MRLCQEAGRGANKSMPFPSIIKELWYLNADRLSSTEPEQTSAVTYRIFSRMSASKGTEMYSMYQCKRSRQGKRNDLKASSAPKKCCKLFQGYRL